MRFTIQLHVVTDDVNLNLVEQLVVFDKGHEQLAELGLNLTESKALLEQLQRRVVEHQTAVYLAAHRCCEHCGKARRRKGTYPMKFRTLFGTLNLNSPRYYHCRCEAKHAKTFSPLNALLTQHTAPELLYLETKWGSLMAYGLTTRLLKDVLPIAKKHAAATVRNDLHQIIERDEGALGQERLMFLDEGSRDGECSSRPDGPITVGMDGAYLGDWQHKNTNFEVIVGKSLPTDAPDKYFGFVHSYDARPKRRLFEVLKSQGLQWNQPVTFLTDGAETVRALQQYINPDSEHVLDWFHIAMRVRVLGQYLKGIKRLKRRSAEGMEETLEKIRWYLWHGNPFQALYWIKDLEDTVQVVEVNYSRLNKLAQSLREFRAYIEANEAFIPNYGERRRYGERIATSFVESTVNAVVSKRFAKRQQMQWTRRGAHLLLQARTRVLNDELGSKFARWYPGFVSQSSEVQNQTLGEDVKLAA